MDLTIVIVSFKSGEVLDRCIKSIDSKYQIIIVENSLDHKLKIKLEKHKGISEIFTICFIYLYTFK